jgi:osmotically-inducible protein OsmY
MKATPFQHDDNDLREDVFFELESEPKITSSDVAIAVKNGVVTLSGFVPTYDEKFEVEKTVKRLYGVKAVADDMRIKGASGRTDPEIARDAVRALEYHIDVPSEEIVLTVEDGWIRLEGVVENRYQKEIAGSVVRNLKDVQGIMNNLEVEPKISTTEVKQHVEDALRQSAEPDAQVAVEVEEYRVKLYGSVRSWSARSEAETAAWSTPGVAEVENHICVIT